MNKLEGFFELKTLALPSVPWERYTGAQTLDSGKLWTVRVAISKGNDFNLPRKVGVSAAEAMAFADNLLKRLTADDYIIYYPYFIADKSGTLEVSSSRTIIEAVDKDLWNLVTLGNRDITIIVENGKPTYYGNKDFLAPSEIASLMQDADYIRQKYRRGLMQDNALLFEWSYAYETDQNGQPNGPRKLIYLEMRTSKRVDYGKNK